MSLAHLLRSSDARLRLDLVRPTVPRLEGAAAPPLRLPTPLAASAVAAAIRFELTRATPEARSGWPAARAPERLETLAPDMVAAAQRALDNALGGFRPVPLSPAERALQLARLEAVVRAGYVDARLGEPEEADDVAEVAAMLERVPWRELGEELFPLPLFPELADALPDAEPDALVNDTLLAVSAARAPRVDDDELRALVARLLVARAEWGADAAATRIRSLGVLLARHGVLWRVPVAPVVEHEAFPAVETWFRQRLAQAKRDAAPPDPEAAPGKPPLPKWVKKRFAPRTPGTAPEGKAEKKKAKPQRSGAAARAQPPKPPRPARRVARPDRSEAAAPDADDATKPRKPPKPDWRRGSQWRRDRGL